MDRSSFAVCLVHPFAPGRPEFYMGRAELRTNRQCICSAPGRWTRLFRRATDRGLERSVCLRRRTPTHRPPKAAVGGTIRSPSGPPGRAPGLQSPPHPHTPPLPRANAPHLGVRASHPCGSRCYPCGRHCYPCGRRCYPCGRRSHPCDRRCYPCGRRCYPCDRCCYPCGRHCYPCARRAHLGIECHTRELDGSRPCGAPPSAGAYEVRRDDVPSIGRGTPQN